MGKRIGFIGGGMMASAIVAGLVERMGYAPEDIFERVGQTCIEIKNLRPVEPYKGKGIKFDGEYVRRKVGKSGTK